MSKDYLEELINKLRKQLDGLEDRIFKIELMLKDDGK